MFVRFEHVGTNSLRTTNEQLPYHQSRLSRSCELYYNRYLHTLRGLHVCVHVRPHVHTRLSKLPQLKSSCIKSSCLLSHFISVIFSSLSLSHLCHFTHFFFPLLLIPLCFSLFVILSDILKVVCTFLEICLERRLILELNAPKTSKPPPLVFSLTLHPVPRTPPSKHMHARGQDNGYYKP